jgi:two-component system cell cycle response regulator
MPSDDGQTPTTAVDRHLVGAKARRNREPYLVCLAGPHMGKTFVITPSSPIYVGRGADCQIVVEDRKISRRHVVISTTEKGRVQIEDLQSTNGTLVNGTVIQKRTLRRGDQIFLSAEAIFRLDFRDSADVNMAQKLYEAATCDPLTGVFNKRHLLDSAQAAFSKAVEDRQPFSVLMMDIDEFKRINDKYGHLAGDYVLQSMASLVRSAIREDCIFGRYGGEEFTLSIPEARLQDAYLVAERLRDQVAREPFNYQDRTIKVTVSVGIATCEPEAAQTLEDLIAEADRQLYAAKSAGRNTVRPSLGAGK